MLFFVCNFLKSNLKKSQLSEIRVCFKRVISVGPFTEKPPFECVKEPAFPVKLGVKSTGGRAETFSLPACDVREGFVCACVYVTAGCVKACIAGC